MRKIETFALGWTAAILSAIFVGFAFGLQYSFGTLLAILGIAFAIVGAKVWKEGGNKVARYGQLLFLAASEVVIALMAVWVVSGIETIFPPLAFVLLIGFNGLFLVGASHRTHGIQKEA